MHDNSHWGFQCSMKSELGTDLLCMATLVWISIQHEARIGDCLVILGNSQSGFCCSMKLELKAVLLCIATVSL